MGASGARPATENPHGKRQSHILAVAHNSEQTVLRTTGLWLLVQYPPSGSHVGHTGGRFLPGIWENVSDKILPVDPTLPPKEVSLWHGAPQQAEVRPQCSSALPLFPQCPTAVCASVSLSTRVQLTSSTTGFYLQLPNMFQLEYYYSENDVISILTVSGHADASHVLKKLISAFSVKLMERMGTMKLLQVPPAL